MNIQGIFIIMDPYYQALIILWGITSILTLIDFYKEKYLDSAIKPTPDELDNLTKDVYLTLVDTKYSYKHPLWPSPRPVNLVRNIIEHNDLKIDGRLTHGSAINFLGYWANIPVEDVLEMNPIEYVSNYMKWDGADHSFRHSIPQLTKSLELNQLKIKLYNLEHGKISMEPTKTI